MFRNLRITVTREVNKIEFLIDQIKIDGSRLPRGGARFGETPSANDGVDE
jgi:hypothetical protein